MAKQENIGALIKKARTDAGMTQAELARQVGGITAQDISKAERGQKDLSSTLIQAIAGATGNSLLETAIGALTSGALTNNAASEKKTVSIKVTESEKTLLQLYRDADNDTKKKVVKLLKNDGNDNDLLSGLLGGLLNSLK